MDDDGQTALGDVIADHHNPDPASLATQRDTRDRLTQALASLHKPQSTARLRDEAVVAGLERTERRWSTTPAETGPATPPPSPPSASPTRRNSPALSVHPGPTPQLRTLLLTSLSRLRDRLARREDHQPAARTRLCGHHPRPLQPCPAGGRRKAGAHAGERDPRGRVMVRVATSRGPGRYSPLRCRLWPICRVGARGIEPLASAV